ncbi:hypothetical protein ILYODFUR_017126 [Ilyodon furcidens]|uniref:Uncharacterized protein n=1 Tax=Ilyodon furcidens TaxID=33524 RepID=A0ABV0T9U3_9TELE
MSANIQETQPRPFVMTTASKHWSSGICDCFHDLSHCCFAFWCFPCFTCKTSKDAGECLCLPLVNAFGLIPPMTTALRVSIRHRYNIEGTICICILLRALHLVSDIQRVQDKTKSGGVCQHGCLIRTNTSIPHQQPKTRTSQPSLEIPPNRHGCCIRRIFTPIPMISATKEHH